jgi:hypothetical protein
MTKGKHTPWKVVAHNWQNTSIYDAEGHVVCSLDLEDWGVTEDNQDALEVEQQEYANLIASAPDMAEYISKRADLGDADAIKLLEAINGNA